MPELIDLTCNGECTKCGECCSNILPLTDQEVTRLKKLVKKRHIKPHTKVNNVTAEPCIDLICPFLDEKNRCSIYEDRPYICRIFMCNKYPTSQEYGPLAGSKPVLVREEIFKNE